MLRALIVAVILAFAVVTFKPDLLENASDVGPGRVVRDFGENTLPPAFRVRLEAGAECAELISIQDTYTRSSEEVARMSDELRAIGCNSVSSMRTR